MVEGKCHARSLTKTKAELFPGGWCKVKGERTRGSTAVEVIHPIVLASGVVASSPRSVARRTRTGIAIGVVGIHNFLTMLMFWGERGGFDLIS